jgi:hypothetical protein
MAPKNESSDPDRIDISLDIVGMASLDAINKLAAQMGTFQVYMGKVMGAKSPEAAADAAREMAEAFQQGKGGPVMATGGQHGNTSRSPTEPVPDGRGKLSTRVNQDDLALNDETMRERAKRYAKTLGKEGLGPLLDQEANRITAREREQADRRGGRSYSSSSNNVITDSTVDQMTTRGGTSRPPGASGTTPGINPNHPAWARSLESDPDALEKGFEGWTTPRYGNLTLQDKLGMGAGVLQRSAYKRLAHARAEQDSKGYEEARSQGFSHEEAQQIIDESPNLEDTQDAGRRSGRGAVILREAAAQAPQYQEMYNSARQLGQRAVAYGSGIQAAGTEMGYERAGGVNVGLGFGFQDPRTVLNQGFRGFFGLGGGDPNSASYEGGLERNTQVKLMAKQGITGSQAKDMIGNLRGAGYSGKDLQNMALGPLASLVQQGQDPNVVVPMLDKAIRNGNSSLKDFTKVMGDLGPSAKEARQSLSDYTQALDQNAKKLQSTGANYTAGLAAARGVGDNIGLSQQQAGALLDSPYIQGQAARLGVSSSQFGTLANVPGGKTRMTGFVTDALKNLYRNTGGAHPKDRLEHGTYGRVVQKGTDRQAQLIAQLLGGGNTAETVKALLGKMPHIMSTAHTNDLIDQYDGPAAQFGHMRFYNTKNYAGLSRANDKQWGVIDKRLRANAPHDAAGRKKYIDELKKVEGMTGIDSKTGGDKRSEGARNLLRGALKTANKKDDTHKITLGLTGRADQLVQIMNAKGKDVPDWAKKANRGQGTRHGSIASGESHHSDHLGINTITDVATSAWHDLFGGGGQHSSDGRG